jgi:hypothetical protein
MPTDFLFAFGTMRSAQERFGGINTINDSIDKAADNKPKDKKDCGHGFLVLDFYTCFDYITKHKNRIWRQAQNILSRSGFF